ncbi:MAG: DUF4097 family beta strand repeat protein [Acidobacteria bacterium]|nr:DUF4097 family beta strand repeat protein [Acidobacteriota bacterium]
MSSRIPPRYWMRRFFAGLIPMIFLASASCAPQVGALVSTETRELSHRIPAADGREVRIANLAGTVELTPGGAGEISIEAVLHAAGKNDAETQQLLDDMRWEIYRAEGKETWTLTYPVDRYSTFHFNESGVGLGWNSTNTKFRGKKVKLTTASSSSAPTLYADLKITVPNGQKLFLKNALGDIHGGTHEGSFTLDTGSGAVDLDGFSGELTVDTGSGGVTLGTVRGETTVDTGSGDVDVEELVGNGRLDTGSGDIRVRKLAAGRLVADTGSGDVYLAGGSAGELLLDTGSGEVRVIGVEAETIKADTGSGDIAVESSLANARLLELDTGSGDVRILAGSNASFDIAFDSGSGDLVVQFDDTQLRRDGRKIIGARRGSGQPRILVDTGSGDCQLSPAE